MEANQANPITEWKILLDEEPLPVKEQCEGLIFRYTRDTWIGSDADINFRDRFRFLKSKSCDGCERCDWLWTDLQEFLSYPDIYNTIYPTHPKLNQLYTLQATNFSTDWETGITDDWDLEFVEYTEPKREEGK